ncbi:hypothetical protein T484DRAFT_1776104, partial [Baffinella frigidus]
MPSAKAWILLSGAAAASGLAMFMLSRRRPAVPTPVVERAAPTDPAAAVAPAKATPFTPILLAEQLKQSGTTALTAGKFDEALIAYGEAIRSVDKALELGGLSTADTDALSTLKAASALNAAMASLKLQLFSDAVKWSTVALEVEPPAPGPGAARSCKALFRRASGKVELGEQGDGALNDLRLAVALSPKPDSAVLALLARAAGDLARQKTLEGAWDEAQNLFKESGQASPPAPPRKRAARRDAAGKAGSAGAEYAVAAMMGLAQMLYLNNDHENAGAAFLKVADKAASASLLHVQALDGAVRCLMSSGEHAAASAAAERLVAAVGAGAEGLTFADALARLAGARVLEGEARLKEGRFREADAAYEAAETGRLLQEEKMGGNKTPSAGGGGDGAAGMQVDAMRMRGYCADALKDNVAATRYYQWALQLATSSGDSVREAQVRLGLGATLHRTGDTAKAGQHLEEALRLGTVAEDEGVIAAASGNLGKVQMGQGEHALAAANFTRAFHLREKNLDLRGCAAINVGGSASLAGNDAEAEEWYRKALAFSRDAEARD